MKRLLFWFFKLALWSCSHKVFKRCFKISWFKSFTAFIWFWGLLFSVDVDLSYEFLLQVISIWSFSTTIFFRMFSDPHFTILKIFRVHTTRILGKQLVQQLSMLTFAQTFWAVLFWRNLRDLRSVLVLLMLILGCPRLMTSEAECSYRSRTFAGKVIAMNHSTVDNSHSTLDVLPTLVWLSIKTAPAMHDYTCQPWQL